MTNRDSVLVHAIDYMNDRKILVVEKKLNNDLKKITLPTGKVETSDFGDHTVSACRVLEECTGLRLSKHYKATVLGVINGEDRKIYCVNLFVDAESKVLKETDENKSYWMNWDVFRDKARTYPNLRIILPLMMCGVNFTIIEENSFDFDEGTLHSSNVIIRSF